MQSVKRVTGGKPYWLKIKRTLLAYMCDNGLIDFAVPILV